MKPATLVLGVALVVQTVKSATIPELKERTAILQQYIDVQSAAIGSNMETGINDLKSTLNSEAETLKKDIAKCPNKRKCRSWIGRVQSIQKQQINPQKTYEPCKMREDMGRLISMKDQLAQIIEILNDLEGHCRNNCENQIAGVENSLKQLEDSIKEQAGGITDGFVKCILELLRKISARLNDARKKWKKCA